MKKIIYLFFFISGFLSFSQGITITGAGSNTGVQNIVENILINSPCAEVSNFTTQGTCGVGSFTYTGSGDFFSGGMIIRNGTVANSSGTYSGNNMSSVCSGLGDNQLTAISQANGNNGSINDVSFVKFDFTPLTDNFSFNFIFASNEYGTYQCGFSDVFAFILTDLVTGTITNLALIPGTTTPVSVTNIRDNAYNGGCPSVNPEYFDVYNVTAPVASTVMNMRGYTVPMTASATVIPNNPYSIKLAIGDYNDTAFDSAVFIQAGSFNVGTANLSYPLYQGQETGDMTIANGLAMCPEEVRIIDTGLDPSTYAFVWTKNGVVIAGAAGATYTVTEPGNYCVAASAGTGPSSCVQEDCVLVEFLPDFIINPSPNDLYSFGNNFNLNNNTATILNGLNPFDYDLVFFSSLADANDPDGIGISNFQTTTQTTTTFYATVRSIYECQKIAQFNAVVVSITSAEDMYICDATNPLGSEPFDLTTQNAQILGALDPNAYTITYHTTSTGAITETNLATPSNAFIGVEGQTIYVRVENNLDGTDFALTDFDLHLLPLPTASITATSICEGETGIVTFSGTPDATIDYTVDGVLAQILLDSSGSASLTTPTLTNASVYNLISVTSPAPNMCTAFLNGTASATVSVTPLPSVSMSTVTPVVCSGEIATLNFTGTPDATVNYLVNNTAASIVLDGSGVASVTTSVDATYCLVSVVSATSDCTSTFAPNSDCISISILSLPTATISNSSTICNGDSAIVTIDGTPNANVEYIEDGLTLVTIQLNNLGTYSFTTPPLFSDKTFQLSSVTSQGLCVNALNSNITIQVSPLPTVSISTPASQICSGEVGILNFVGTPESTVVYTLNGVSNFIVLDINGLASISTTIDATYCLVSVTSVTSPACTYIFNPNSDCVSINVLPLPTASLSVVDFCEGQSGIVSFTGTPGSTLNYTVDGVSNVIVLDVSGFASVTTTVSATYCLVSVTSFTTPACTFTFTPNSECLTINILPLPTATISSSTSICDGDTVLVTITGSANASVDLLENGVTASTIQLDSSGIYSFTTPALFSDTTYQLVSITSEALCSQNLSQSMLISVNPLPTVSISTLTPEVCFGDVATLDFTGSADATVNYTLNGALASVVLDGSGSASVTTTVDAIYCLVSVTSATLPACTFTFTPNSECVTIAILPLPTASVSAEDICAGDTANVVFTGTPDATVNYTVTTVSGTVSDFVQLNASGFATVFQTLDATYDLVSVSSNTTPVCSQLVSGSATVNVLTSPVIGLITAIRVCDDNNDGYATFDLSSALVDAELGNSGTTVTIHETQSDADFPSNALSLAEIVSYNNIVPFAQELFIRVENSAGCFTTTSFFVHVDQRPELNQNVTSYELCETSIPGDGFEVFDLTNSDLTNDITAGVSGLILYYYESQADALANTTANAIASSNAFTNTVADSQTIYITAVNAAGCIDVTSVDLIVNPLPEITPLNPMNGCSDGVNPNSAPFDLTLNDDLVTDGQPGYTVTYYLDQVAADAAVSGTELASPYNSISNPQTVYVRVQNDATGCYSTTTLELNVTQGPVANTPAALHYCDPNNDGFGTFNLEDALNDISGGVTPAGVIITFHETPEDATFGTNAIDTSVLYNNIVENLQTIYISVSYDLTGCANYTQLQLIVDPTPELVAPTDPLQECDAVLADGMAQFDLTQVEAEVLNGINPTTVTITYHLTQQNAVDGTPNISNVLNYNGTNGQTIYIRVTYNATGCFAVESFDLVVNSLPIMPVPEDITMSLCDVNNTGDQIECFDLESQIPLIINGQIDMIVTFHLTQLDAINNTATLSSPYCNTSNAQSIFVRLENELTGCFNTVIMDLRVEPLPLIVVPDPIEECDADGDGFAEFDLTALITDMLNGASDVTLTFYETFDDANQPSNEITNPATYQNIDPLNQMLYVRAENDLTGCYTIEMIELVVHPAPLMPELDALVICDTNYDGQAYFDLTQQNANILAGNTIAASQLQIRYYTSATSAMNGTNAITVPTNYLSQLPAPQTIWVVVTDLITGCKATGTFDLIVNLPIDVRNQNNKLTLCDDVLPNDQFTSFDLTVMNAQITLNTPGATVIYYPSVTDMNNGTNAIGTPTDYTNALPAVQTLGVLVTTAAGCTSKTTLTIRVEPLPTPKTDPTALILCDDDQTFIGTELFDVTVNESYIQDGYPNLSFEYYASMDDLNNGVQIPDATMYEGGDALATPPTNIVYIKVMNNRIDSFGENCYQIVEQELIVNPLPAITDTTFVLCDDDSDGMAVFTLSDYNEQLLGATQLPADFTVSYYDTQANAQAGTSVGLLSNTYNGTNLEMIYPLVIDNATGCRNALATVTLSVKLRAVANPISQTTLDLFSVCDYDGINDGFTTFDLTAVETELLGAQIMPPISITYHLTPLDQASGANAIANPASYTNTTVLTETIYIRVARANDDPNDDSAPCYDVSQILINVEPLAEPFITSVTGSQTICVNELTGDVNPNSFLTLDSGVPAGSGYTYQWFLDGTALTTGTNATYEVNTDAPGIYTVVVTSTSVLGCVSDVSNDFTVIRSGPAVNEEYTVSNAFEDLQNIQVTNNGYGEYHYQLDDGPILDNGGLFLDVTPGPHSITIYDVKTNNPCDAVTITGVSVINYPHYFTPNGDGIHDNWNIIGLDNQPNAKIYIFDRYGKLIKQISATSEGWNGTFNGQPLPSTDYWFSVDYLEGVEQKQFKAHFTLKR